MTIKEISKLIGKNKSTISRWIDKEGLLFAIDKLQNATSNNPANFELNEVIEILKAGKISNDLISLLKENAKNKNAIINNNNYVTKEELKEFAQEVVKETFKQILPLIQNNTQNQLEYKQDYYSIIAYANLKNIKITFSEALKFGKEAARLSRNKKIDIRQIPDEKFGKINSYNINILNEIFKI